MIDVWARLKVNQFHAFTRIGLSQNDESYLSYSRRQVTLVTVAATVTIVITFVRIVVKILATNICSFTLICHLGF